MTNYSVAAIVACYNSEKFIDKTINSILDQKYDPLEIIAVDDGSTDRTLHILKNYSPKIKILCHPDRKNHGQPASINIGIQETKADLIAFIDHDDLWYPTKLKEQVKIFEKYPNVGVVYTNVYDIDENDNILYKRLPDDFKELNMPGRLLLNDYIVPASVMVKKSLFEKTGLFDINFKVGVYDHDMWLRLIETSRFYYLPKCLTAYRLHPGQLSQKREMWELGFVLLKKAYRRYPYSINTIRKRIAVLYYRLGKHDLMHRAYLKALFYFILAGMCDPLRGIGFVLDQISFHRS